MNLWALQTSRLSLPWLSDYKVIPPSLSCSNWISLRDLLKLTLANATTPPPHPLPKKYLVEFSKYKLQHMVWERHTWWLCLSCGTDKVNITSGGEGRAHNHVVAQVSAACWASLGARWLPCQQAGPGLIKDVGPNWSCQHLLRSHAAGWRRSSAQRVHESDLEESRNSPFEKHQSDQAASVSDIKWTVHTQRKYCCCATAAICINPVPPSWINH